MSVTIRCDKHELNMSNRNFSDFINYFEVAFENNSPDLCGEVTPEESKAFVKRILEILVDGQCSLFEEPTVQFGNIVECGRDARYVHDRLYRFLCIFSESVALNKKVTFA